MSLCYPHVCPVCQGRGYVPPDFYNPHLSTRTNDNQETCRSCKGVGYIWETPLPKVIKMHSPRLKPKE